MFGHRLWRGPRNDLNDLHGEIGRTQGRVVGTDSDAEILSLARQDAEAAKVANVKFQQLDACAVVLRNAFDLAYARFLLSHLNQPNDCVGAMIEACTSGGIIVIEDTDLAGSFCYPICDAYERYNELYQELVRRRGGDPNIGPKLSAILRGACIQEVDLNVIQPAHIYGEGKLMAPLTMSRISDPLIAEGLATKSETRRILTELNPVATDCETVISLPRIFQLWGKRTI